MQQIRIQASPLSLFENYLELAMETFLDSRYVEESQRIFAIKALFPDEPNGESTLLPNELQWLINEIPGVPFFVLAGWYPFREGKKEGYCNRYFAKCPPSVVFGPDDNFTEGQLPTESVLGYIRNTIDAYSDAWGKKVIEKSSLPNDKDPFAIVTRTAEWGFGLAECDNKTLLIYGVRIYLP